MARTLHRLGVLVALLPVLLATSLADEGQWPPDRLAALDWDSLRARGLRLAARDIWNDEGTALAMAVVKVGGCSGSFVSATGLIATNHHCVQSALQQNSTAAENLFENGFLAQARSLERRAPGLRAWVLRGLSDVTAEMLTVVAAGMDDAGRAAALDRREKELVMMCEARPATRCRVGREFGGQRFMLFESAEIDDLRLVYAPPAAVGNYGGETDNWMWPRHSGDFAVLRAYVEDIPYHPVRHLRLSSRGVRPGDLVMVMGYPGATQRYLPSAGVRWYRDFWYPQRQDVLGRLVSLLEDAGSRGESARLAVTASLRSLANRVKNAQGMQEGMRRNGVLEAQEEQEGAILAALTATAGESGAAGQPEAAILLDELNGVYTADVEQREGDFLLGVLEDSVKLFGAARRLLVNAREQLKPDLEREAGFQERDQVKLRGDLEQLEWQLDSGAESAVLAEIFGRLLRLPAAGRPAALAGLPGLPESTGAHSDFQTWAAELVSSTALMDTGFRLGALEQGREALKASTDSMLALALRLEPEYDARRRRQLQHQGALVRLLPRHARLLQQRRARVYPDANGTLRISMATVKGYRPRDGVWMDPQTTVRGILEKETGEPPFASPPAVLATLRHLDPGSWSQAGLGEVPVCFLSDADTTGGNSGSPVVNGLGELVGLNFDRVFENIAGDFGYRPALSRNISVDVRYLLWMLEKVKGAYGLLRELGFEPSPPQPRRTERSGAH